MISLDEFISKYLGQSKGYPTDKDYPGQCLSICKLYIKECFGIKPPPSGSGSAYGYWSNFPPPLGTVFKKITNTAKTFPLPGDIVIWKPWTTNQYGHISICLSGDINSFVSLDQNWGTKKATRIIHDYKNVVGYLRSIIKPLPVEDNMTEAQKHLLEVITELGASEGDIREGVAYVKNGTVAEKDKQIQTLQARVLSLEKDQKDLADRLTAMESNIQADLKLITDSQLEVEIANKSLENANKSNIEMIAEKNRYKGLYENALKEQVNKYTPWQLIKMGINLLIKK